MPTITSKILITGGAGFIGSNLCDHFISKGYEVVCLDNLSTGFYENIKHLKGHPDFTFIEGDIRDPDVCKNAVSGCEYVLHQAALGSVPRSINDPITTNDVNIGGFLNMLVAAKDEKVKRFIFAASSSTYGDSKISPKEEDKIGKPLSPYAITKYVNELYADVFHKTYGLDYIGLRYFNVFGQRQTPDGAYAAVIPKFVSQFMNGEAPVINGDGSFSRDFTYIKNVIHMNERALQTNNPKALNQIYNTAFGTTTSLNELVELLKQELSHYDENIKNIAPVYGPERKGDIPHSLASIDKAKTLLEYDPAYSIKDGIQESIKWYWDFLKN
ncbi:MAG: SDR family oxidoreductase [Flavobacteriia bacterium]|nr:SDR family oxidoreductase [Flavobacteriia bacterium]OJX34991.1 MAG: LPS biosynthesis protein WbpP [Flavobacteriia bacterium 40-80]